MPSNEDDRKISSDDEPGMSRRDFIRMRLAQLDEQDTGISRRIDEDFIKRRAVFDAEFNEKLTALDKLRQTQLQAVTRRTLGEHFCLQNSIEQEVIDLYNDHFKCMFPDPQQFYDEYIDALKKYEYLDDERRKRNVAEGKPAIDVMSEDADKAGLPVEGTLSSSSHFPNLIGAYDFESRESIDVTEQFISDCQNLGLGELATTKDFTLMDCMSSIELMDPKMDQGMIPIDLGLGLEHAISSGKLNTKSMPMEELIATFDATMACIVSFLNSNSLDQTVYTNICLSDPNLIEDEVLKVATIGLLQLTRSLKFIIDLGGIAYDEDISLSCRADESMLSSADNDHAIDILKQLEKKFEGKKNTNSNQKGILHRLKFIRYFLETISAIVPPSSVLAPDSEEGFVVNFKAATVAVSFLSNSLDIIEKTVNQGLQPGEGKDDGDYSWLPAIEPDVNRHLIPNTFPRAPVIGDRVNCYKFWKEVVDRMIDISRELPLKINTVEDLLNYIREFTANGGDVFTRSLLQVAIAPFGDSIFGNIPLSNIVVNSLQATTSPMVLDKNYPLYHSPAIQQYWQQVLAAVSRSFLSLVQIYGMNETRQREQICGALKEFNTLYAEAEHMDKKFTEYLEVQEEYKMAVEMKPFCLSAYIGQHLMELMRYYIVLGFKLELFVPYEFQYCYWYLGEVISMWRYRLFEQSREYLIADLKLVPNHVDPKKFERKKKQREGFVRRKLEDIEANLMHERIDALMCRSLVNVICGLISAKHLEIPEGEKNRYSARFEPFAHVPVFARINHDQYLNDHDCGMLMKIPTKNLYERAKEASELALDQLNKLKVLISEDKRLEHLLPIAKKNLVVCRLLVAAPEVKTGNIRVFKNKLPISSAQTCLKMKELDSGKASCYLMLRRAIVSSSRVCTRLLSTIPSASVPGVDVEPSADVLRKASVRPILLKPYLDPVLHEEDYFGIEKAVSIQEMFDARVHYGHKVGTLNDNMKWALYGERLGVCVFDLEITRKYLIRALNVLAHLSYRGGMILFVSSDRANMFMIEKMAKEMEQYSHTRKWQEGTLTNTGQLFGTSVRLPDMVIFLSTLSSVLEKHPGVVEAAKMAIPTIGICDSNSEPNYITYPVPGNDDSTAAIRYYMNMFKLAIDRGREAREKLGKK